MYSNRPICIFFGLIIIIIATCAALSFETNIQPLTDINSIKLPTAIKNILLNDVNCELMYVQKNDHDLQYFYRGSNIYRAELMLSTLKKTTGYFRHHIPNGKYLINLHDGVHHAIGWPVLAFAGTKKLIESSQIILMPDPEAISGYSFLFYNINKNFSKYPWDKKINKIFWRGKTTGSSANANDAHDFARIRFIKLAANLPFIDAGFTGYTNQLSSAFINYLSTSKHFALKNTVSAGDSIAYKYLIDIDGYSCSYSRMAWILYSNSLLLKHQSNKIQWYYHKLKPYVHYVPIAEDFSNLEQQYIWAETHPQEALRMIKKSSIMAKIIFSNYSIKMSIVSAFRKYQEIVSKLEMEREIANT